MRKRETILDWWRDDKGVYFPWLLEWEAWQKAQEAELLEQSQTAPRMLSSFGKAKLSNLVACMAAIRATPEIWVPLTEIVQLYPTPGTIPDDVDKGLASLIGRFTSWFQMKRGLDESSFAYSGLYSILREQHRAGSLVMSDAEWLRRCEPSEAFIDDLEREEQSND